MFFYVFFEKSIFFKISLSTIHQIERFEVRNSKNFLRSGSPSPLPRPLLPLFLRLRPRFGLRLQISGASRPRFGLRPIRTPQLLKRGCALAYNNLLFSHIIALFYYIFMISNWNSEKKSWNFLEKFQFSSKFSAVRIDDSWHFMS